MTMIRRTPTRTVQTLEPVFRPTSIFEDLDRFMERMWEESNVITSFCPATDIYEDKEGLVIKMELPGVKKEKVEISLEGDMLNVKAEKEQESLPEDTKYYSCERCYGSISRSISLPFPVNAEKASAHFEDGVLEIKVPKSEEAKGKQIKIS